MSKGPWPVSQSAVRRLVRGAESAGIKVGRLELGKDGNVMLFPKTDEPPSDENSEEIKL